MSYYPTSKKTTRVSVAVDPARCAPLWDVGAPEWTAGVVVIADDTYAEHDGLTVPVLLHRDADKVRDLLCNLVEHEQLGPLPVGWRQRVRDARWRCGRTTKAGGRCRAEVGKQGDACRWHRGAVQLAFEGDR